MPCPFCNISRNVLETNVVVTIGARNIKALKVKCSNLDNGCQWIGEFRELETHHQSCDYALVSCTNKCDKFFKVLRKDLHNHITNDCPRRPYMCPYCWEAGEYQERTTTHFEICPDATVKCPNPGCDRSLLRCQVSTHRSTCEYEPIPCKYTEVGCKKKPLRKHLKKHEEDDKLHLRVTTDTVLDLKRELKEQSAQVAILANKVNSLENKPQSVFRLTNFSKLKPTVFHSCPFYTSPGGYKMCISVYCNGIERSYVSAYVVLMKGDNDDFLTWPFPGTVTIQLLNQLEDKNHHERSVEFSQHIGCGERVLDCEIKVENLHGFGMAKYISHDKLDHQQAINCQYLRDYLLIFRIFVTLPNYKPWLECM